MIMSKTSSPKSVTSTERIPQGRGRRLDCEREFKKIMKDANHEITSRHPTMEGVLLGRNTIPLEAIPNLADPDDFVEKTRISSLITLRVKEEAERTKATTTTKALILGWFNPTLEDYINSNADLTRAQHWENNDWPQICDIIRRWYLEPITQSTTINATLSERDTIMWEYRSTFMKNTQDVLEWEAEFRDLIEIVNNPLQAGARKGEVEQAKDFVDKLSHMFNDWKTEVRADEDRQQQTLNCGGPREPYKGYPQSLAEAVNRAKMVEKQVTQKRARSKNQNLKETNLKRDRTNAELSNFALVKEQTNQPKGDKPTRLTYQEIKLLGKSAKASDHGFENCRYCEELKVDSNHIFINCDNNPRKRRSDCRMTTASRTKLKWQTSGELCNRRMERRNMLEIADRLDL